MAYIRQTRGTFIIFIVFVLFLTVLTISSFQSESTTEPTIIQQSTINDNFAIEALKKLSIKGRAPKTDYSRGKFGSGWAKVGNCDTRNTILKRDMTSVLIDKKCNVISGTLLDPYSGQTIDFERGSQTSSLVQIDHVVALSDAWQKGAQQLSQAERTQFSNDPLELLAVSGSVNQSKSDGDAATWLPPNKAFRCQYIARQVAVKVKYKLWLTAAEYSAMADVLNKCPGQLLPI